MLLRRYHDRVEKTHVVETVKEPVETSAEESAGEPREDTREGIEKMPYYRVKSYAKRLGLETEGKNTGELRDMVIDHLGL